jgi:hypothetical protein
MREAGAGRHDRAAEAFVDGLSQRCLWLIVLAIVAAS